MARKGSVPGWRSLSRATEEELFLDHHRRGTEDRGSLRFPDHLAHALLAAGHARGDVYLGAAAERPYHLFVGRLALDHRLGGQDAIVVARLSLQRVEIDVLILKRVHQLVVDRDRDDLVGRAIHDVEHFRLRIVDAEDLLGEQIDEELSHVHGIGNQPEHLVRDLLAGELALGRGILELREHEGTNLIARLDLELRRMLEGDADGLLDQRDIFRDTIGVRPVL
jgi:hypothetical protein